MTRNNTTLAEELTQETFCRVIDKKHLYDRSRGLFVFWLYRLAMNLKNDWGRKISRAATVALEMIVNRLAQSSPVQLEILIAECLDELDGVDRRIILLTMVEGFTLLEAARILDMPPGTIGRRRHKALKKLQVMIGARPAIAHTQN